MDKNYKIMALLLGLVLIFLILNFFYFKNESGSEINKTNNTIIVTKDESLKTYVNEIYNFSIQYPSSLTYKEEDYKKSADLDVYTTQPDFTVGFNEIESDLGLIRLNIYKNTKLTSLEDWLKADNQLFIKNNNASSRIERVLEKTIKIDGSDAFVTFIHSAEESDNISKHERKTALIKDGNLFVISTRFVKDSEHDAIWKSLKFSN